MVQHQHLSVRERQLGQRPVDVEARSGAGGAATGAPNRRKADSAVRALRRRLDSSRKATLRSRASGSSYADTRGQTRSRRMNASCTTSSACSRLPAATASIPTSRA